MKISISDEVVLDRAMHGAVAVGDLSGRVPGPGTPDDPTEAESVVAWLGRLRLLQGVPFEYLIPDDGLLRPETIRFFHLDRNWTDAAVDGALSAGTFGTRDRVNLQSQHEAIRDAVDEAERDQWQGTSEIGTLATATGFLMRSRAVSGWPGMHVRAFRGRRRLQPLRIERLSPAVLLALFDDEPDRMEVEEPRQGIQFGAESVGGPTSGNWQILLRDDTGEETGDTLAVRFRRGSAGVVHVEDLVERLEAELSETMTSSRLAQQLVRYPYRQRFGDTGTDFGDHVVVRFRVGDMNEWHARLEDLP